MESKDKLITAAISGFKWSASVRLFSQIISWLVTLYVIRILSSEAYGLVSISEIFTTLSLILVNFGITRAIIQRKDIQKFEITSALGISILIGISVFSVLFLIAPLVSEFYGHVSLIEIVRATAFIFLLAPFQSVYGALLDRELKFKEKAISNGIANVSSALLSAYLAFHGYGVWSLVIASIVQNFVVTFMYIYFNNAFYLPSIKFGQAKDLFSYTKRSFIAELLMFFSNKTPAIIGAKIYGVTQLGYFSVAGQLSALILTKVMPVFNQVGFTTFSRLNETGNHESIEKYIKDLMVVTSIITFPTFWGLGYTSGKWLPLLIGETWSASVSLLLVMTLVIPFRIFSEILSLAFEAQDKTDIIIKIRIYSLLLSISLIAIFYTLQFGIINLAFSGLASGIFSFILLASIPVDKKCITLDIIKAIAPAAVASILMITSIYFFNLFSQDNNITIFDKSLSVAIDIFIGITAYTASIFLIAKNKFFQTLKFIQTLTMRK